MMSVSCARGSRRWKIAAGNAPYIRIYMTLLFMFFLFLLFVFPSFLFPFRVCVRTNTMTAYQNTMIKKDLKMHRTS